MERIENQIGKSTDLSPKISHQTNFLNFSVSGSFASTLDTNKYKFLTKLLLDDLEIIKRELTPTFPLLCNLLQSKPIESVFVINIIT